MPFHTVPASKNPIRRLTFSIVLCCLVLLTFPSVRPTPSASVEPSQNPRLQSEAPRVDKAKALSAGCCDQKTWAQKSTTGPSPRSTALAYDQARMKTVLFGGYTSSGPGIDNQTWLWDGAVWAQANPATKPSARRNHNLAYDSDRQVTVLFGGEGGTLKQDTWEWDGTDWKQRSTTGPAARQNFAMTYDSQRHVTILFGGQTASGHIGDTWEWNGTMGTWSLTSNSGPSPRSYARMVYDPVRDVTVLFGGADNISQKGDTWEWKWNGTTSTWTQITPAGVTPMARASHGMAYDPSCGVVIFGGYGVNGNYLNDTWSWDGTAWTLRAGTAPNARSNHGMAYDKARNALVVFGGFFSSGPTFYYADTWERSGGGAVAGADLWMKDTMAPDLPEDFGAEPTVSQLLYISRDIWVRDTPDTATSGGPNPGPDTTSTSDRYYMNEHQHQDPTYVNASTPSYLYVKVRNRGCAASAGTERLRVYWTNAASGSPWPSSWNEIDCAAGGAVDPCPLPVIAPGQDYVMQIPWVPPNPGAFGVNTHFCLLARIETQPTLPFGMTSPEGTAVWQNVATNNNIAWKNIAVLNGGGKGHVIVRNTLRSQAALELRFAVPAAELKNHFLMHGDIFVDLGRELMAKWRRGGQRARGFRVVGGTTIQITDPANAVLAGLTFSAGEEQVIEVRMQLRRGDKSRPGASFNWDVIQMQPTARSAKPVAVGGMRYNLVIGRAAEPKGVKDR